jgi:site-specific recombinase XerD
MPDSRLIGSWIRRFLLEHLVDERNLSLNTQKSYRDTLIQLLPFLSKQTRKPMDRLAVSDLTVKRIKLFLRHVELDRGCGASTRNQRLSAIRAFARFVAEHAPEHLEWQGQVRTIPIKKAMEPTVTSLDRHEMKALLATPVRSTAQGARDYAVLLFLFNSGARVSEAVNLAIADIDWHGRSVRVLGKGNRVRMCPLWSETVEVLRSSTSGRQPSERVFLNRYGEPYTRSGIHALVKRYAARARRETLSLTKKTVGPHVIRHSSASNLLRAGVDINTIRGWLGHKSLDTTNIYAEIDMEAKARALGKCAIVRGRKQPKHWRQQPALMEFLRAL